MKKTIYEEAKLDVIRFENEDIITDSNENNNNEIGGGGTNTGGGVGYNPDEE